MPNFAHYDNFCVLNGLRSFDAAIGRTAHYFDEVEKVRPLTAAESDRLDECRRAQWEAEEIEEAAWDRCDLDVAMAAWRTLEETC